MNTPVRIPIVGGGFAGLESAFLLRSRLGARADLTLISNTESFLFKPNTIYIPLGGDPESLLIPLARPTSKRDIRLVRRARKASAREPRRDVSRCFNTRG
jgi:sulfide:quinone oxidoreductase